MKNKMLAEGFNEFFLKKSKTIKYPTFWTDNQTSEVDTTKETQTKSSEHDY